MNKYDIKHAWDLYELDCNVPQVKKRLCWVKFDELLVKINERHHTKYSFHRDPPLIRAYLYLKIKEIIDGYYVCDFPDRTIEVIIISPLIYRKVTKHLGWTSESDDQTTHVTNLSELISYCERNEDGILSHKI